MSTIVDRIEKRCDMWKDEIDKLPDYSLPKCPRYYRTVDAFGRLSKVEDGEQTIPTDYSGYNHSQKRYEASKRYRIKNKERCNEWQREWRRKQKEEGAQ